MDYPIKTPNQLGTVMAGVRRDRKLTQVSIGKKVGLAQNAISGLEASSAKASVQQVFKLLSALELDLVLRDRRKQPARTDW